MKLINQAATLLVGGLVAMFVTAGALRLPDAFGVTPALAYAALAATTGLLGCAWFGMRVNKLARRLLRADMVIGIVTLAGLVQSVSLISTRIEWHGVPGPAHTVLVSLMLGGVLLSVASMLLASTHLSQMALVAARQRRPLIS